MKYKSVANMVLALSNFKFSMRFLLKNQHRIESVLPIYQENCRIYLDEYLEQKKLRKEWLEKNKFTFKKLQEMIAKAIGEPYVSNLPEPSIYEPFVELHKFFEPNPYQHFIDRFNKRN